MLTFFSQEVRVEKPAHELNIVEVQTAVSNAELRLLTRGKLVVSIASKKKPTELRLEGRVTTRATCEIFQVTCVIELKLQ
jgi:hypothetical protein